MQQRTCPVCRRSFTPATANQRFCPPTADERARIKPGNPAVSYCGKAYQNAKRRGTLEALLAEPRLPPAPFDCAQCGKRCVPGENVAAHAAKFCGYDCKDAWHREHEEGATRRCYEQAARQAAVDRLLAVASTEPTAIDSANYRRAMLADPCAYCGEPSQARDHIVPREAGGTDDWTNRTGACHACNNSKWTMPLLLFLGYATTKRAFEPWRQVSVEWRRQAVA